MPSRVHDPPAAHSISALTTLIDVLAVLLSSTVSLLADRLPVIGLKVPSTVGLNVSTTRTVAEGCRSPKLQDNAADPSSREAGVPHAEETAAKKETPITSALVSRGASWPAVQLVHCSSVPAPATKSRWIHLSAVAHSLLHHPLTFATIRAVDCGVLQPCCCGIREANADRHLLGGAFTVCSDCERVRGGGGQLDDNSGAGPDAYVSRNHCWFSLQQVQQR